MSERGLKAIGEAMGATSGGEDREVPCRGCGEPVTLGPSAWDLAKTFSKILHTRGERGFKNREVTACDKCRRLEVIRHRAAEVKAEARAEKLLARVRAAKSIPPDERRWLIETGRSAQLTAAHAKADTLSTRKPGKPGRG